MALGPQNHKQKRQLSRNFYFYIVLYSKDTYHGSSYKVFMDFLEYIKCLTLFLHRLSRSCLLTITKTVPWIFFSTIYVIFFNCHKVTTVLIVFVRDLFLCIAGSTVGTLLTVDFFSVGKMSNTI